MVILKDDVQIVKVSPGVPLSPTVINNALFRANSNKMYAKFIINNLFIQVNFMRDGTISVSSNIRTPSFVNDLAVKSRKGWTFAIVKAFVYQWLTLSRRTLV